MTVAEYNRVAITVKETHAHTSRIDRLRIVLPDNRGRTLEVGDSALERNPIQGYQGHRLVWLAKLGLTTCEVCGPSREKPSQAQNRSQRGESLNQIVPP